MGGGYHIPAIIETRQILTFQIKVELPTTLSITFYISGEISSLSFIFQFLQKPETIDVIIIVLVGDKR